MYVTKRGNKYRAWERIVDLDGSVRKISVTMDRDTPQARNKARAQLREKMTKPRSEMRYEDLVKAYIKYQQATLKTSTWKRNEASLMRLKDTFSNARLDVMTAGFITTRLLDKTAEPRTFNEYLKRVKAMFRWAYRSDLIDSSACVDKIKPLKDTPEREKVSDKFLEADELKAVLDAADDYYGAVFGFLALSGLRIGELIALDDEDVSESEIIVRKTYDWNHGVMNTPKTSAGWRRVHVQPELLKYIRDIRKMSNLHRLISRARPPYFVVNVYGGRLSYHNANYRFKNLCARLTGKRLTLHALRHSHVALMAAAGADLDQISRRIGHSTTKVTKDIYFHVTEKQREKDNKTFDAITILA